MRSPQNGQSGPAHRERRSNERRRLRLRARARDIDRNFTLDVLDISHRGMLLRGRASLDVGDKVEVELNDHAEENILATVAWAAGKNFGCYLERELTSAELARALLRARPHNDEASGRAPSSLQTFGERVRHLRKLSPYTMAELAAVVQVSKPTLWKWETGRARPREAALDALARALGTNAASLVYGIDDDPAQRSDKEPGSANNETIENLPDLVGRCRTSIARGAGVKESKVTITIDWD